MPRKKKPVEKREGLRMKAIWKFPFVATSLQTIRVPAGAKILSVQNQQGTLCLWALVDIGEPLQDVTLRVVGTGHPIDPEEKLEFLGTVQVASGSLIWHVFSVLELKRDQTMVENFHRAYGETEAPDE